MKILNFMAAGIVGAVTVMAASAASASHKPAYCDRNHDHRSHNIDYYDYYAADKFYRAGPYRQSGVSFSVSVGDRYDDRYAYRDRYARDRYYGKRNGYRGRDSRVVNRQVFDTRHRARIVLTEEVVRSRRGPRLICTVEAKGRERAYVSKRRLHRIAERQCSPRARVKVYS